MYKYAMPEHEAAPRVGRTFSFPHPISDLFVRSTRHSHRFWQTIQLLHSIATAPMPKAKSAAPMAGIAVAIGALLTAVLAWLATLDAPELA